MSPADKLPSYDNKSFYTDGSYYTSASEKSHRSDTSGYSTDHVTEDITSLPVKRESLYSHVKRHNDKLNKVKKFMYSIIKDLGQEKYKKSQRSRPVDKSSECDSMVVHSGQKTGRKKRNKSERIKLFSVDDWTVGHYEEIDSPEDRIRGRQELRGHVESVHYASVPVITRRGSEPVAYPAQMPGAPSTSCALSTPCVPSTPCAPFTPCDPPTPTECCTRPCKSLHYASSDVIIHHSGSCHDDDHIYEIIPYECLPCMSPPKPPPPPRPLVKPQPPASRHKYKPSKTQDTCFRTPQRPQKKTSKSQSLRRTNPARIIYVEKPKKIGQKLSRSSDDLSKIYWEKYGYGMRNYTIDDVLGSIGRVESDSTSDSDSASDYDFSGSDSSADSEADLTWYSRRY